MAGKPTKSPKRDSSNTGRGKKKVAWQGYVNLSLTDTQKAGFEDWIAGRDVWGNEVPTLLDSGYNLSVSVDAYNDAVVAGLYCVDTESENAGWKLTARGADPWVALGRLLYIHCVLLEGDWSSGFQPSLDSW